MDQLNETLKEVSNDDLPKEDISINDISLNETSLNDTSLSDILLNGTSNDTLEIIFKNTTASPHDTVSFSDPHLMPVYIVTGIAAVIFIIGPVFVRKGPNQGITRWCIQLTVICCWLLWVSIYLGQMNPLIGPRMSNTSLAWVGYCWGADPKKLEEAAADESNATLSDESNVTISDGDEKGEGGTGEKDEKGEHEEETSEHQETDETSELPETEETTEGEGRRSNENPELPSFRVY